MKKVPPQYKSQKAVSSGSEQLLNIGDTGGLIESHMSETCDI